MKPMIFLNTAWMDFYEGLSGSDEEIHGGGSYVEENGYGYEIFNFKKIKDKVYGYAQPHGINNLQRLGASIDDNYIDGVWVIFTAKHKDGGTYIVGWYKNATFFKEYQTTKLKDRKFGDEYLGYFAIANAQNAILLSVDERFSFPVIPRGIKGGMGQSNVWYADSDEMLNLKKDILAHIEKYEIVKSKRSHNSLSRQADTQAKRRIEKIAIQEVTREYIARGFIVNSCEKENMGWDLDAIHNKTILRIEAKGLTGENLSVEITPNEFKKMDEYRDTYRLCVVTECIVNPTLHVFSYSSEKGTWLNEDGIKLIIDHIIAARCYV